MGHMPEVLNEQTIFDQVAKHLVKQGKKAAEGENCLYRGPDGTECAFGCLIPDDRYNRCMEQNWSYSVIDHHRHGFPEYSPFAQFINQLQTIHDGYDPSRWKESLRELAKTRNLTLPDCLEI